MCERGRTGEAPTRQRTPRSRRRCRVGLTTTDIMEVLKVCTSEGAGAQAAEQAHLPPYLQSTEGRADYGTTAQPDGPKGRRKYGKRLCEKKRRPGTTRRTRRRSRRHLCEDGGRLREAASGASEGSTAPQSLTANSKDAEEEPKVPDDEAARRERDGGHQPYAAASDAHEGGASPEQRPDRRATIRQAAKPSRTAER